MTDPAQPDEYAKLKAQKEAILLRQSPNKKLLSRLVELKELVENYHGVFPNRAVIAEALRDAAAALVSPPVQPVEATPETWRDLVAAMVDAHEFMAPGPFSPPEDWVRMPWKRWEAIDRFARSLERQLHLAQTENAGHIRIEDELKSDLAQAQERCAELEKALTRIEEWSSFPPAESNGEPCSYGVAYGSNGERDYMRGIAKIALKARPKPSSR